MASATYDDQTQKKSVNKGCCQRLDRIGVEVPDLFIYATAASLIFPQIFAPPSALSSRPPSSRHSHSRRRCRCSTPLVPSFLDTGAYTDGREAVLIDIMFLMGFSTMARPGSCQHIQQVGVLAPKCLLVVLEAPARLPLSPLKSQPSVR